ncbi:MAG: hypothetical protein ACLP9C_13630 [Acidimicrobiales bacterium]
MIRRPLWVATGVVIGVGGTLWAEQRVRRGLQQAAERLTPHQVAAGARDSARQLGARVRGALEEGRDERERAEAELWESLEHQPGPTGRSHAGAGRRGRSVRAGGGPGGDRARR